jgi:hypothetical protein
MIRTTCRILLRAALGAAVPFVLAASAAQATPVDSTILLGPANGAGNAGTFSASVSLGSGSSLALGASAISGNYKQHIVFVNTNIGFSAQNQTASLSLSPSSVSISTSNSSGSADLSYDDVTPGTPQTLNAFSANLSDGASAGLTINSTGISMSTSVGTFTLTPTFTGSLSGVSFTSSASADASSDAAIIPGTFSVILNGSVTGSLNVLGANLSVGTLFTLPTNTVVSFAGDLPSGVALSDTGVPFGNNPTNFQKNTLLADFAANLGSLQIPFQFVAPLATSENFSVGSSSSGVTSIKIQNTTLTANIMLSNLAFNLSGTVPNVLAPEPSSMVLGTFAVVGLVGFALKRRKAT